MWLIPLCRCCLNFFCVTSKNENWLGCKDERTLGDVAHVDFNLELHDFRNRSMALVNLYAYYYVTVSRDGKIKGWPFPIIKLLHFLFAETVSNFHTNSSTNLSFAFQN